VTDVARSIRDRSTRSRSPSGELVADPDQCDVGLDGCAHSG